MAVQPKVDQHQIAQLSNDFVTKMKSQNKQQRKELQIPFPTIQTIDKDVTDLSISSKRKREIEKDLGITSGTFKFKKASLSKQTDENDTIELLQKKDFLKKSQVNKQKLKVDEKKLEQQLQMFESLLNQQTTPPSSPEPEEMKDNEPEESTKKK
ncbi:hypothetical protein QTN25_007796 [Entamoeba marina]